MLQMQKNMLPFFLFGPTVILRPIQDAQN